MSKTHCQFFDKRQRELHIGTFCGPASEAVDGNRMQCQLSVNNYGTTSLVCLNVMQVEMLIESLEVMLGDMQAPTSKLRPRHG